MTKKIARGADFAELITTEMERAIKEGTMDDDGKKIGPASAAHFSAAIRWAATNGWLDKDPEAPVRASSLLTELAKSADISKMFDELSEERNAKH